MSHGHQTFQNELGSVQLEFKIHIYHLPPSRVQHLSSHCPLRLKSSNATAEIMDEEVKKIVDEAYKRTLQLMNDKKDQVQYTSDSCLIYILAATL